MKKAETIIIIIALLGVALNLFGIPGGSFLIIISCGLLSLLYFYFGFALSNNMRFRHIFKKDSYKGLSPLRILGSVLKGFALSIVIIGLLFRIMFWSGSTSMLINGIVPVCIVILVAAIKFSKGKDVFYSTILKRTVPYASLAILFLILPVSFFTQIRHRDNPEYVNALKVLDENPQDEEAQRKVDEIEAGFRKMNGQE